MKLGEITRMNVPNPIIIVLILIALSQLFVLRISFKKAKNNHLKDDYEYKFDEKVLKKYIPRNCMITVFFCILTLPIYSEIPFILPLILAFVGGAITYINYRWINKKSLLK